MIEEKSGSHLIDHAKHELALVKADGTDYGDMLPHAVLELIEVFSNQGHSGMSAKIVIYLFAKLASFEVLSPLTGSDDEWTELADGLYQNKRCSHVFKENNQAYDSEGKVFEESDGSRWFRSDSRVLIEFPYMPVKQIVKVID